MSHHALTASIATGLVVAAAAILVAGPLNPPAGPVASTFKTLTEIEPRTAVSLTNTPGDANSLFKITQPGSYYLTGNITGVANKHGVEIAASGVTLDLNGFDLAGVAAMGFYAGVDVSVAGLSNICITNGSVRNWGSSGVTLSSASACRVEGVLASGNGSGGAGNGISLGGTSTITNCSASSNVAHGITGGVGCAVTNCSASDNAGTGFFVTGECTFTNCSSFGNGVNGFTVGNGSTLDNCSASSNSLVGISTTSTCTLTGCAAYQNGNKGISVGAGCTVTECAVVGNSLDGIQCVSSCVIRDNTCTINGNGSGDGAGIHATGADNRIEGNNCTLADRGIDVDIAGNVILRNTCSGNTTNWSIAANNIFGPILDRTAPASAAVGGNSAASTLGSTDANANYTY